MTQDIMCNSTAEAMCNSTAEAIKENEELIVACQIECVRVASVYGLSRPVERPSIKWNNAAEREGQRQGKRLLKYFATNE